MERTIALLKQFKTAAFSCAMVCASFFANGQGCTCPALSSCAPCSGGLIQLTLRFNGVAPGLITVSDQLGEVFSGTVNPGGNFSFLGSIPNEKFVGLVVQLSVDGVLNALISSACGTTFVGSVFGSFAVLSGQSLTGGALCCADASMETIPPTISNCPSNISVNLSASACTATVSWTPPSATDNCSVESLSSTHVPGSAFPRGSTQVVYTATDIYANTSTCSFTVTVNDIIPPTLTGCPSEVLVTANASCKANVSWTPPTALDNCVNVELTSTHAPGSQFLFGITEVTYTAADVTHNTATCTFPVRVTNPDDPEITGCPDPITVEADEGGVALVTWEEPQASVLCGTFTTTKSHEPGSPFPVGVTTVTYEFEDESGKSASCAFDITVSEPELDLTVVNVMTPNGDGIHDTWYIQNIENYVRNSVLVVDRWGNKIFQGAGYDNINIFWDGTNERGAKVPTGTYFYTIEVHFQGRIVNRRGFLEVVQ